jgi:alanine dehydrogenase
MTYTGRPGLHGGLVFLFSTDTGELLALMNDGYVQHLRVAATGALGAKYLARADSHVLGIIGSGGMARTFARTMSAVRPIERIVAWSPNRERLEAYCEQMREKLGLEVVPVDGPEAVCREADILCACTNSLTPVVEAEWIRPGTHLNNVLVGEFLGVYPRVDAVGLLVRIPPTRMGGFEDADFAIRRFVMTYMGGTPDERARVPVTPPSPDPYPNARFVDCVDRETGQPYARGRDEITLLANASYGTYPGDVNNSAGPQGIQFATVGGRMYDNALRLGIGTELPRDLFLQDTWTYSPGEWRTKRHA